MSEIKNQEAGKEELDQPKEPENKLDTTKKGFATDKLKQLKPKPPKPDIPEASGGDAGVHQAKKESSEQPPSKSPPPVPNTITDDVDIVQVTESNTKKTIIKLAEYLHKSNLLPDSIKKTEEAVVCIQTSMALGYRSFGEVCLAIKNMYVINNQVNLWGDLPLSLVRASGLIEKIDEFFINEENEIICFSNKNLNDTPSAAVILLKRKGEEEREFFLTAEDLEISGGTRLKNGSWQFVKGGKASMTWKLYPKIHWKRRLRGKALYDIFPDILQGRHIYEYHHHPGQGEENTKKIKKVENFIQKDSEETT